MSVTFADRTSLGARRRPDEQSEIAPTHTVRPGHARARAERRRLLARASVQLGCVPRVTRPGRPTGPATRPLLVLAFLGLDASAAGGQVPPFQRVHGRTVHDRPVWRVPAAVAGAVPGLLGVVPGDQAAEVGAHRAQRPQGAGGVAVDRQFLARPVDHLAAAGGKIGHHLRCQRVEAIRDQMSGRAGVLSHERPSRWPSGSPGWRRTDITPGVGRPAHLVRQDHGRGGRPGQPVARIPRGHEDVRGHRVSPHVGQPVDRLDDLARPARAHVHLPQPRRARTPPARGTRPRCRPCRRPCGPLPRPASDPARPPPGHAPPVVVGRCRSQNRPGRPGPPGLRHRQHVAAHRLELGVQEHLVDHRHVGRDDHGVGCDCSALGLHPAGLPIVDRQHPRALEQQGAIAGQSLGQPAQVTQGVELRLVGEQQTPLRWQTAAGPSGPVRPAVPARPPPRLPRSATGRRPDRRDRPYR